MQAYGTEAFFCKTAVSTGRGVLGIYHPATFCPVDSVNFFANTAAPGSHPGIVVIPGVVGEHIILHGPVLNSPVVHILKQAGLTLDQFQKLL